MSLQDQRREYRKGKLTRESLDASPFVQFRKWMDDAENSPDIADPTAMVLATVDAEHRPWQRMVLLKGMDEQGFVFYTNLSSNKARDIAGNPNVALHFPWNNYDRQVIVAGSVEKLSTREALAYFMRRPRESQLAAWASRQSMPISSRQILEAQMKAIREKFASGDVPLPDFWGGFRVVPREIEFWQGGENRLHDRFRYYRTELGWEIKRLSP